MTPEEYQRFKEAEKDHLRKLREIKKLHGQAVQKAKITQAVNSMTSGMTGLYDEHREMVDRLQMDTLQSEARMEVALDAIGGTDSLDALDGPSEAQDAAELAVNEEAIRRARAQALIRQMKVEGGASIEELLSKEVSSESRAKEGSEGPSKATSGGRTPLTEKPKPTTSSNLPEKTIGRMKP
ncbi:MAG: hypothetical protein O3B41_07440 [Bacteroidetes bacterium]|nr:hypothetical protein [Bacteroidota bacterium]